METKKVYAAISAVAGELAEKGISKGRKQGSQVNYAFRGIDDVYNALAPALVKHKLLILPRCTERTSCERTSKNGGALFYITVRAEFDFVSTEDGSLHTVVTYGEAMDSGDKATNKAMSIAYKYAAFQAFCIPTEETTADPDYEQHQVNPADADKVLADFTQYAGSENDPKALQASYAKAWGLLDGFPEHQTKCKDVIDLKAGTMMIRRNFTPTNEFTMPKTKAGTNRVVFLIEPAIEALRSQAEMTRFGKQHKVEVNLREYGRKEKHECTFVFDPRLTGRNYLAGDHYAVGSIKKIWDAHIKRAGLRHRNAYQTRHTYACWSLSAGANPNFIATQMGHADAQMVYKVYGKWMAEKNTEQVALLNQKLSDFAPSLPHDEVMNG